MNKIRLLLMFSFLFLLTTGFQIFTNRDFWNINNSSAASRKLFIRYSGGTEQYNNNLPASDVLAASGATVTLDAIINSVLNDYNAIGSSYVQLVLTSDSDFAANSTDRIIDIVFDKTNGTQVGQAEPSFRGYRIIGCRVVLNASLKSTAKQLVGVMTHEMGHCLGLDHPQDTVNAIMSYFRDENAIRLNTDDKMGITYLYPLNSSYSNEVATFGFSCARRE
ncbi:MAG: matrixin family metalloprotease [Oligoflexia bacterium]|nr:matrixin family metalloprotease [Oligoflexia bacterium]